MKSRRGIVIDVSLGLLLLVVVLFTFCSMAQAAEPKGDLFVPLSVRVIDNLGFAAGLGWQDRKTRTIVFAQVTYDRIDVDPITISIPPLATYGKCNKPPPQWRTATAAPPDRNAYGVAFTVAIPLKR
jgi:hypothetical protein